MELIYSLATFLGFLIIFQLVLSVLVYIMQMIRVFINATYPSDFFIKYGTWAVVTGCTDGIGLAYTRELARRGLNVVLISRSKDKLQAVATELETEYKVKTRTIVVDFSDDRQIYERIRNELKNIDIGVLVNNVGFAMAEMKHMEEISHADIWNLVSVNVLAATMMTSLVLPDMKKRCRGAIVNLSSLAGLASTPYVSVYSATKVYISNLTRSLQYECRDSGVTIQLLYPSFVNTQMLNYNPLLRNSIAFIVPSAETYSRHAIAALGIKNSTSGYFVHDLLSRFSTLSTRMWNISSAILFKISLYYYQKQKVA